MSTNELVTSSLVEGLGHIVLNRPAAYNALNTTMVTAISTTLRAWEPKRLDAVLIRSDAVKAFCAGGDIKNIRQQSVDGDVSMIEDFFAREYAMNAYIATYQTPVISLINGLCMGGGDGSGDPRTISGGIGTSHNGDAGNGNRLLP